MILGGDIGGTKCNLAAFDREGKRLRKIYQKKYHSREVSSFTHMLTAFLGEMDSGVKIQAACFGVAGPVIGRSVHPTNLSWPIDADAAGETLGTDRVRLINDMGATFAGIDALEPDELLALQQGKGESHATQALIAAGTGLGESFRVWTGSGYQVIPSEGGHADLAPRTEMEIKLLRFLKQKQEWVDLESVISGRGFQVLHEFLDPALEHPEFQEEDKDRAAEITSRALQNECAVCVEAVDLWLGLYGAEAGNLALKTLARGGIFIAGGIAGKILPKLTAGRFVEAFSEKAALADVLASIPITVVLNPEAPLVGAAATAAALL